MPKKFAILGGTGRTGIPLIDIILKDGNTVKALVRDPSKMKERPSLEIIRGDVNSTSALDKLIQGVDVVIIVIAHPRNIKGVKIFIPALEGTLEAMKTHGVDRIVLLTSSLTIPAWSGFIPQFLVKGFLLNHIYDDIEEGERILLASNVKWTIAQPDMLIPHVKNVGYKYAIDARCLEGVEAIPYGDLASALYEFANTEGDKFVRKRVHLRGARQFDKIPGVDVNAELYSIAWDAIRSKVLPPLTIIVILVVGVAVLVQVMK